MKVVCKRYEAITLSMILCGKMCFAVNVPCSESVGGGPYCFRLSLPHSATDQRRIRREVRCGRVKTEKGSYHTRWGILGTIIPE